MDGAYLDPILPLPACIKSLWQTSFIPLFLRHIKERLPANKAPQSCGYKTMDPSNASHSTAGEDSKAEAEETTEGSPVPLSYLTSPTQWATAIPFWLKLSKISLLHLPVKTAPKEANCAPGKMSQDSGLISKLGPEQNPGQPGCRT